MSERHPKEGSGGGGAEAEAEAAEREPGFPTNGGRDERMQHAVEIARNAAEERATAEILALEDDVERERLNAAKSLDDVQRRLEEAEAKAATVTVTDMSVREEAAEWLREQRDDVRGEIEAQVADESKRLQAEFDEQLRSAIAKVEAETEARMKVEASRGLSAQAVELRNEADQRVQITADKVSQETEQRLRAEIDGLTTELEGERESRNDVIEKAERLAAEADERAAEAENARLDAEAEVPPVQKIEAPAEETGQDAVTDEQPAVEAPKAATTASTDADASTTESRRGRLLDANQVAFEELRELGLSITQATRVIAYRERQHGFDTLDDMDTIPGFPEDLLAELKQKLTA